MTYAAVAPKRNFHSWNIWDCDLCFICLSTGGPGLDAPYRQPNRNQITKMIPARPNYPGMMPGMPGGMPGIMGPDKPYQMTFKPHATMPQGPNLRQQLQVRLVSLYL